jgi:tetratricopeptide (TPR) repeat protein
VADRAFEELQSLCRVLDARLNADGAAAELEGLKAEIGALYKTVDSQIVELTSVRDDVLKLVEKWKGVRDAPPPTPRFSIAPEFAGAKPAVQADHLGASTFIEKGWSRISAGDHAGAEEALNKALELSPGNPQAESLLGWALMLQDKFDDALLNFQKVLVHEPQNALARINVGYICLKKGIFGEAIEHLSRAIRLGNDKKATLYAHFYLGLVYLERDMFEDAQTFFRKAIALGPNMIEAYFELGRAYWYHEQRDEAIETWKAGIAANAFNTWGKRCAEALATAEAGGRP